MKVGIEWKESGGKEFKMGEGRKRFPCESSTACPKVNLSSVGFEP